MTTERQTSLPTQEANESAKKLYDAIQSPFPKAVENFESKWTAWLTACEEQPAETSVDACAQTKEFDALKRLGPKIIPFVVFKLSIAANGNSYGVFLYNALENDPEYRAKTGEPLVTEEILRRHSIQIVELNYQRHKIYKERVGLWKEHCWKNRFHSSVGIFTECDEYFDLLEMGPSIIAPLMVEYFNDHVGYWYELLHEIVHGRKMGAYMVQRGKLFVEYCQFFNESDHDQSPVYIPNEWDIYIYTGEMGPQVREHFRRIKK